MLSSFSNLSAFIYLSSTLDSLRINNAIALVGFIERFKLFPFRYRHMFGIVQASLTLLSLNAMFLLS